MPLESSRDLRPPESSRDLRHHAFVIEAEREAGTELALNWIERELGITAKGNPDVIVQEYGLLSVDDARRLCEIASQAPLRGEAKAIVLTASRMYHEAQNALLKLFEEPPEGTYLFLILPSAGMLLPTMKSRVQSLQQTENRKQKTDELAEEFISGSREKRSAIIKKLATGKDEDQRREHRDQTLALVNGIEAALYASYTDVGSTRPYIVEVLREIQLLRGYLHDRSAPVKMILEHLAIVLPKSLQKTENRKQ